MKFSFPYRVRPVSLLLLSLMNIYRSMAGVVNIIFTVSMGLLAFRFWSETSLPLRLLMAAGILLFPVFQPLMIFLRSRKIVSRMPDAMRIDFDRQGMTITAENHNSHLDHSSVAYSEIKSVIRIMGMLIIYTQTGQGFVLGREIIGDNEDTLYKFLVKQVRR